MSNDRRRIVAAGYDELAERYLEWAAQVEGDPRERLAAAFAELLPDGARVLDLGCGPGLPSTKTLARRFVVVGIDASEAQVELARGAVPEATFVHGDMLAIEWPSGSFDGVTAFYSIVHVPREEHAALFARIARWLAPGGVFLATLGVADSPDWVGQWVGVPMFFSGYDADANRRMLLSAGFELLVDEIVDIQEPEGQVSFLWVIAQKPLDSGNAPFG